MLLSIVLLCWTAPSHAVYFLSYEKFKKMLHNYPMAIGLAGAGSTVCASMSLSRLSADHG